MIVLDANILIRAVLGRRVRELIDTYSTRGVRFFAPDVAFADAEKYLPPLLKKRGKPHDLSGSFSYLRKIIEPVTPKLNAAFKPKLDCVCAVVTRMTGQSWPRHSGWRVAYGVRMLISLEPVLLAWTTNHIELF